MIIQPASPNQPQRIILQADHARMSGQFAAAFGNDTFAPPKPRDLLIFVASHHDEGWIATDSAVLRDERTGLPYHLTQTPLTELLQTSRRSPDFNESHHSYCGLLSSMHSYGLFHGRYGLSDKVFIDHVPAPHKEAAEAMLAYELARQTRLKAQLAEEAETAVWVQEEVLFHNYKLLQFFDTLALYFHLTPPEARGESHFPNVPCKVGDDVTVTIQPLGDGRYQLTPYPFAQPELAFQYDGRFLSPQPPEADLAQALDNSPVVVEQVVIGE